MFYILSAKIQTKNHMQVALTRKISTKVKICRCVYIRSIYKNLHRKSCTIHILQSTHCNNHLPKFLCSLGSHRLTKLEKLKHSAYTSWWLTVEPSFYSNLKTKNNSVENLRMLNYIRFINLWAHTLLCSLKHPLLTEIANNLWYCLLQYIDTYTKSSLLCKTHIEQLHGHKLF